MDSVHRYKYYLVVVFLSIVSGQYLHPKEYLKSAIISPTSVKAHSLVDPAHMNVEAIARNTPFESLVTEILEAAEGHEGDLGDLELDLPYNVSAQCRRDFKQFMLNITEMYALQMLDAAGKFPSGVLQGNTKWWGRYDQCRSIKADDTHDFNGGYCLTTLTSYKPGGSLPSIQLGVCVPDSCNATDVDTLILSGILQLPLGILEYYPFSVCSTDPEYSAGAIAALIIFSLLGFLIVAGTALDIIKHFQKTLNELRDSNNDRRVTTDEGDETMPETMINGQVKNENLVDVPDTVQLVTNNQSNKKSFTEWIEKFLMCFSALTNGKKILAVQTTGPHSHLAAINGIRVISMWWVILGHTHIFIFQYVDNQGLKFLDVVKRFSFQAVGNATYSVDSFFVLSGLLVCYFALNELKAKDGRLNWGLFYFHRFWRLTPVYMLVILMWTTLVPHFSSGPTYFTFFTDFDWLKSGSTLCKEYWWTNLLYINNLYPKHLGEECLGWSWYLANDMQFYVISPIILYLLYRFSAVGYALIGALMAVCFTSVAVVSWKYDISPSMIQPNFHNHTVAGADDLIYIKPWTRINSYLAGMVAGYVLYLLKGQKWNLSIKHAVVFYAVGWCCAIATGVGVVYGLYGTYNGRYQTQPQAVFYFTTSRFLWSSAVAWVAFACATGFGGPVNTLLGWIVWGPLARLTYCAYLLHPIILMVYYASSVEPFHYTDYTMIYLFLGNLVLAYAAAFVMSVCAEAPFMALEKLFLPKRGVQTNQKN